MDFESKRKKRSIDEQCSELLTDYILNKGLKV